MSVKYVSNAHFCDLFSSFILIVIIFTSIYFVPCGAVSSGEITVSKTSLAHKYRSFNRLAKRDIGRRCLNSTDCEREIHGSVCVQHKCMCPQGYLPNRQGTIVCLRIGKKLGSLCNISEECGDDLDCRNHVCQCREGFHLFQSQGINMCLLWHKPTRILERCILTDGCSHYDLNSECKKRWCQCKNGYQMFETMLFGRKQRCFKTFQSRCDTDNQCSKFAESPDQFCQCSFGVCHCLGGLNNSLLEIPNWSSHHPNWYQRWKKDLILATRLLFITVILFFVPCFIYVTLGVRERSRQLFSQIAQPSRVPPVHYSQRRPSNMRPLRSYRGLSDGGHTIVSPGETHHVELAVHANGINSRLVDNHPRRQGVCENRDRDSIIDLKEEDPPPSYEEIMRRDNSPEAPPPPYREL